MAKIDEYQVTLSALSESDGGGFLAEVFELPGCIADGESKEEALQNISDAIESWIDTAKAEGRNIPDPKLYVDESPSGKFTTRVSKSVHATLIKMAEQEGVSLNSLVNTFLAMGIGQNYGRQQKATKLSEEHDLVGQFTITAVIAQNKNQWEQVDKTDGNVVSLEQFRRSTCINE
nr:MAG TPA: putative nuclease [Caudoviricetes sp.]